MSAMGWEKFVEESDVGRDMEKILGLEILHSQWKFDSVVVVALDDSRGGPG